MESWYEIAQGAELRQGSLLCAFPIVRPPLAVAKNEAGEWIPSDAEVHETDIIVLSQSCDLAQNKSGLVSIAPIAVLTDELSILLGGQMLNQNRKLIPKFKEQIRRGHQPNLHMLAPSEVGEFSFPIQVADFRQTATVSFAHLQTFATQAETHLRLRAPFREHLSQAYARFMMRVALESEAEIPRFSALP